MNSSENNNSLDGSSEQKGSVTFIDRPNAGEVPDSNRQSLRSYLLRKNRTGDLQSGESTEEARPLGLRRRSTFVIGSAVVLVVFGILLATMWSGVGNGGGERSVLTGSQSSGAIFDLPSNGWKPGMPGLQAIRSGAFHASVTGDKVCAWIGDIEGPMLWPAGYRLGTNPVQLIGPDGTVVANEGDIVQVGGGALPGPGPSCGSGGMTWSVQGEVTKGP
jgi:hypothetical protein